jgi:hypothetical protein
MAATGRWRLEPRAYRLDDGRRLVVPLVHRNAAGGHAFLSSMPDAWGFGGPVGEGIDADVLTEVLRDLWALRRGWIRIRPNPLHASHWLHAAQRLGTERPLAIAKRAHVLDIDRPADELFRDRFSSAARRAIRSAEKAGIEVESDTTGALAPTFHQLLLSSVERWAGSQHEPLALARWRAERRDPVEKFTSWSRHLDGGCRILIARRGGTPIAGMIVLIDRNAHYTRGAMDRALVGSDRPNELLMWHAIQAAAEAGCRSFHLGESGTSANLARYKEKFGAVGHDYAELRIERVPATRLDAAARRGVKRVIGFRD